MNEISQITDQREDEISQITDQKEHTRDHRTSQSGVDELLHVVT